MHAHALKTDPTRRYVLVFDDGEDVVDKLKSFAREQEISAAVFTGIGSFRRVVLGLAERARQQGRFSVVEDAQVISLDGTLRLDGDDPEITADVVVVAGGSRRRRGWLRAGRVRSALKLIVVEAG